MRTLEEQTATARQVLKGVFGFDGFRPGQEAAIEALLAGRNVLTVMPTGSGKSLCFQIPALITDGLTVVVSPLVALMQDQVAALRLAGVAADSINSANGRADNIAAWRRAAAGETRLLYMAPERLMTEPMLASLARLPVKLFAIDEAHCISQWGPAFRPEYEDLCGLRDLFPGVPIAALTATADEVTREDIAKRLFEGSVESFVLGFDRPNIKLSVEMKRDWKRQLRDFIARHEGESGIVYCLSRKKTEETAALLTSDGIRALPLSYRTDTRLPLVIPAKLRQLSGLGFLRRPRRGRAHGLKLEPPGLQLRWRDAKLGRHTAMPRTRPRQPGNQLFLVFRRKSPPRRLRHLVPPERYLIYRLVQDPGARSTRAYPLLAESFFDSNWLGDVIQTGHW